jgi:peptidyl-prolyl cis-trans isomerase B (cyclophilin B)
MRNVLLILLLAFAGSCLKKEEKSYAVGQIKTSRGEILVWLYDETPRHKESFMKLANAGYWDTLTFNRVIRNFVAQGGCPDTPAGFSDSPYLLAPEFNDTLRHEYGALGAGRDDNPEKLSAGCQFYIVQNKEGLPRLDRNFTVYGKVIKGMDVIDDIVSVKTDSLNAPLAPIHMDVNMILVREAELKEYGLKVK